MSSIESVDARVERAVKLRAEGRSWRSIGRELKCDAPTLRRQCFARGYRDLPAQPRATRQELARRWTEIAVEATDQLRERLLESGDPPTRKELAILGGIATDKVAAAEGWNRPDPGGAGDWIKALTEKLSGLDSIELKVSTRPSAIDVTPKAELPEGD
jgi:hypothetical protein